MFKKVPFQAIVGIPAAAAAFLFLTACGGPASAAGNQDQLSGQDLNQSVTLHYKIVPPDDPQAKKGPDGNAHDTMWTVDSTTVHVGDVVTIEVSNYDDMPHSFNAPGLHLNQIILAGGEKKAGKTTFTFKATKAGKFAWHCDPKCDAWSMAHWGFMKGHVTVF